MKYFLTIGGRKYDFLTLKFKREASMKSSKASIIISPARGSPVPAFDEVVLITKEINNTTPLLKWQGKVQQVQDIALPNNVIKIIAYDLKYKVNFINVKNAGYASTKGSSIFTTEVETPAITDLTLGTVETTDDVLDTVSFGKSISGNDSKVTRSTAFEIIQILGDSDIYIHRDGTADYLRDAGTDRSATHILEHGINGALTPDIGYQEDEVRRVKQVIIKGAGTGNNFILGTAGSPSSTDKVKQIELPFVSSNATAVLAAQTVLNELDKTNKYSIFRLDTDLFQTNYDVYDTVTLKARLPNKTINEELKIFSITTVVSSGASDLAESVTLELQNFERAQLAQMLNPIEVSSFTLARIKTGIQFTQSNNNTLPVTLGEFSSVFISDTVSVTPVNIAPLGPFSSQKTNGAYVHFTVQCTIRKDGGANQDIVIRFKVNDGTTNYPIGMDMDHSIGRSVGEIARFDLTIFIPDDVADKTLTVTAQTNSPVDVEGNAYAYSLGL